MTTLRPASRIVGAERDRSDEVAELATDFRAYKLLARSILCQRRTVGGTRR